MRDCPLGSTIPYLTPHAVSVSLPTWADNVDYEEGHERIKAAMSSGYPRFYIHNQIDQLAKIACSRFGQPDELCILLPTPNTAKRCQAFLSSRTPAVPSRVVEWPIKSCSNAAVSSDDPDAAMKQRTVSVHACFFPATEFGSAKQYWQHTGEGISSRVAERCLTLLGEIDVDGNALARATASTSSTNATDSVAGAAVTAAKAQSSAPNLSRYYSKGRYAVAKSSGTSTPTTEIVAPPPPILSSKARYSTSKARNGSIHALPNGYSDESETSSMSNSIESLSRTLASGTSLANGQLSIEQDEDVLARYVEERYGRNLDLSLAPLAKLAMRRRIAGVLKESPGQAVPVEKMGRSERGAESTRGVVNLTEDDVWLYPGGMSAIFHAHQLAMGSREQSGKAVGKSVCFGFPYTDTLKILEKWGPGCEFFGRGLAEDLPALRETLQKASTPILALFCEFPSNPLLRTPPLGELRKLANEFGFMIVVDETIAGFVNVEVLPLADIVVSSLTKVFSGDSNVMGGSLVINPKSPFYDSLKAYQEATYEDFYFDEDAIYMERNSRDFQQRVATENYNAETICDLLRETRRAAGPAPTGVIAPPETAPRPQSVIKEVYYPKYMTPEHYIASLRPPNPSLPNASGFGALFSVTFTCMLASQVFFDHLPCYKGPSLGTNFTLACPYTILAHYTETDWAAGWGVEKGLVRISVGLEDTEELKEGFIAAVDAAEKAVQEAKERGDKLE